MQGDGLRLLLRHHRLHHNVSEEEFLTRKSEALWDETAHRESHYGNNIWKRGSTQQVCCTVPFHELSFSCVQRVTTRGWKGDHTRKVHNLDDV